MVVALLVVGGLAVAHKAHQKHTAKKEARKAALLQQGHAVAVELPTSKSEVDFSATLRQSMEERDGVATTRGLPAYETIYSGRKPVIV